jgi:vacuolar-type H+-ATPase subunit H
MEKIWEELRKIEAQAEQIRNEAKDKAKEIALLAQQEAEKLAADSEAYAEEEALKLHTDAIREANRSHDGRLKANRKSAEKLRAQAEKRMDQASSTIVKAILGEKTY